jgi:hypothetical protein
MSAPEPPDLPKDPAEYRPRRVMGPGLLSLIILTGIALPLAGAGVAYFGPRLLPPKPVASSAPRLPPAAAAPVQPLAAPAAPAIEDVAGLKARIAALESQGARSSEAAAAALAAAALIDASRSSHPFAAEAAALAQASPALPELPALARLAETGAPSRAALYAGFDDFAARAAVRARKPEADAGLGDRLIYAASKVVQVRRVDDTVGDTPDALIARAEGALQDGDVVTALKLLDRLPPAARDALAPWRVGAERRAEIDRLSAQLRAHALAALAPARSGA